MTGAPRGRARADLIYLGWQLGPEAPAVGPMPAAPAEPALDEVSPAWLAAQRREQSRLSRPARWGSAAWLAAAGCAALCLAAGTPGRGLAVPAVIGCSGLAAACLRRVLLGERALRAQVRAEADRVQEFRSAQQAEFAARLDQHAGAVRDWQRRSAGSWRRPRWHPVTIPAGVTRLDLAGGTLAGWSAVLTTIAAMRLAAGGEVTVVDLTEGGAARDLVALAAATLGLSPLVWVLPADLPSLDLGRDLRDDALAEVLALTAAAAEAADGAGSGGQDPARDAALLGRVLEVLGPGASVAELNAGLLALAQVGQPRARPPGGLISPAQVSRLTAAFGRGAEHLVVDRAWALEARLRVLSPLGSAPATGPARLRVVWPDRRAAVTGNRVLGCYLTVALTEVLRRARPGRPWQHSVFLLGAERLPGSVLGRLCDAAESASAGLVLGYRSLPPPVRERLGRGNAAVAFMRLGNAEDARTAAEQIGSEYRFVVSQLTDTVGASVTDSLGDSYTSTVGTSDSAGDSVSSSRTAGRSRGRGQSRPAAFAGLAPFTAHSGSASRDVSAAVSVADSRSVTEGISASTSWGVSTARAVGASGSLAQAVARSRELLVEPHELQHLPPTAAVVCQPGPAGRQVVLADVNPAIMTLPAATLSPRPDARQPRSVGSRS